MSLPNSNASRVLNFVRREPFLRPMVKPRALQLVLIGASFSTYFTFLTGAGLSMSCERLFELLRFATNKARLRFLLRTSRFVVAITGCFLGCVVSAERTSKCKTMNAIVIQEKKRKRCLHL